MWLGCVGSCVLAVRAATLLGSVVCSDGWFVAVHIAGGSCLTNPTARQSAAYRARWGLAQRRLYVNTYGWRAVHWGRRLRVTRWLEPRALSWPPAGRCGRNLRVPEARMLGSRDLTGMYAFLEILQLRAPGERCCSLGIASTAQAGLCGGTLSLAYGTRTGSCCRLRC
ncbi:g7989 [Coccomyxa elongata]